MTVYDLTHPISSSTPVYPGSESPSLSIAATVEQEGYHETKLSFYSHTGTHMDAPAHIFRGAATLDSLSPENFAGAAYVLDCSALGKNGRISVEILREAEEAIQNADFLLLYTGWEKHWGSPTYFGSFPVLTAEASLFLAELPKLKGVGVDTVSVDLVGLPFLENHRILLGSGKLLIENMKNLGALVGKRVQFAALPLHYVNSDGAPVRAIAWEHEK